MPCTCGHSIDEHGKDPDHPGSSACRAEGCDCIAYDAGEDDDDPDDAASPPSP